MNKIESTVKQLKSEIGKKKKLVKLTSCNDNILGFLCHYLFKINIGNLKKYTF